LICFHNLIKLHECDAYVVEQFCWIEHELLCITSNSMKKMYDCEISFHLIYNLSLIKAFASERTLIGPDTLQQQGAILRSKYHRKQQRKMFPKSRCCEP
jgi:hypothetical protein